MKNLPSLFAPGLAAMFLFLGCQSQNQGLRAGDHSDTPASIPVLLGMPAVRQALNLSDFQTSLLNDLQGTYKKRLARITAIGSADEDASLRAGWDLQDLRKSYNKQCLAVLSPSQQDALAKIERQMLGGSLLSSSSEQDLLGLSPDQKQALSSIRSAEQSKIMALAAQSKAGKISPYWKGVQQRSIQRDTSSKMLAVLSPDQRKAYKVLTGQSSGLPKERDPYATTQSLFEGY